MSEPIPACASCGNPAYFKRERSIVEVEYLDVDAAGDYTVDDSDLNVTGDWLFECIACGLSGDDLEELLEFDD